MSRTRRLALCLKCAPEVTAPTAFGGWMLVLVSLAWLTLTLLN